MGQISNFNARLKKFEIILWYFMYAGNWDLQKIRLNHFLLKLCVLWWVVKKNHQLSNFNKPIKLVWILACFLHWRCPLIYWFFLILTENAYIWSQFLFFFYIILQDRNIVLWDKTILYFWIKAILTGRWSEILVFSNQIMCAAIFQKCLLIARIK